MNKAQLKGKILDVLNRMSESERIAVYQDGCKHFGYVDDMIFPMGEFDELEGNSRPFSEVYRDLTDDFSFNDEYYYLDGYTHYHSFSNIEDSDRADILDDLIDYAVDDEYDFSNSEIAEVFEEAGSEEDE